MRKSFILALAIGSLAVCGPALAQTQAALEPGAPPAMLIPTGAPRALQPRGVAPMPESYRPTVSNLTPYASGTPAQVPTDPPPAAKNSPYPPIPQAPVPKSAEALWAQCAGNSADSTKDLILAACSAIINAGREPNDRMAQVYASRARAWHETAQYNAAIADFDQANRLAPKDAAALQGRCMSRAVIGQLAKALADCNAALKLKPDYVAALESRGFTYRKMRAFHRAIADYDAALKLEPKRASALFGRGVTRLDSGDREGQIDIKQAKATQSDVAQEFARYGIYR
jgi:lipoprotein NlpI